MHGIRYFLNHSNGCIVNESINLYVQSIGIGDKPYFVQYSVAYFESYLFHSFNSHSVAHIHHNSEQKNNLAKHDKSMMFGP